MSEILKRREKTRYFFGDQGQLVGEETEYWEPLDQGGEFVGDDLTQSLDHGDVPLEAGNWRIYKVYEKKAIWIRHKEEAKQ